MCDQQICDSDVLSGKDIEEKGQAIARMMKTEFSAQFVIVSQEFVSLLEIVRGSTAFQRVYMDPVDGYYELYFIRPE